MSRSNVDEELARIEAELRGTPTPAIDKPDELDMAPGMGCWLDKERMCGPDCMAYDVDAEPGSGPKFCLVLGAVLREPAVIGTAALLRKRNEDNQRESASAQPVPDPFGKKRT